MTLDFYKLRLRLAQTCNKLTSIVFYMDEDSEEREDLKLAVEDLHDYIATLLCVESTGGDTFKSIDYNLMTFDEKEED
jgi:hypothetical protein